jgi:hypothetical protein
MGTMKAKKLKKEVDKTIKYLCKKVRDDNYMCDYKDSMARTLDSMMKTRARLGKSKKTK